MFRRRLMEPEWMEKAKNFGDLGKVIGRPEGSGMPPGIQIDTRNKAEVTKKVKKAARIFGASLVGVCKIDDNWIYSHSYNDVTKELLPVELPD